MLLSFFVEDPASARDWTHEAWCADLLVRRAFQPLEVPTGAVAALTGAPCFLFLLIRTGRARV